jgi:hypothetical protein
MKWSFCLFPLCFGVVFSVSAQNEFDALRYSTIGSGGTARTMGMAGSFSAIGADASAVMTNPAGIAAFRRSEPGCTVSEYHIQGRLPGGESP